MKEIKHYKNGNHILVGLGGTGGKVLRAFKMRMFEEFPTAEERTKIPVQLLYVDSTKEMMPKDGRARPDFRVMGQDASFTESEFLNIKEVDVSYILDNINRFPSVKGIVENADAVKQAIGALGQAAGQMRRAGRLLFAANSKAYVNSLRNAYGRCEEISGDVNKTYIHILAGLCGGTGSGSIIDAIVQARKTFPGAIITVYAMIPEMNLPKSDMDKGRYYPNGYAAVNELNALQAGRFCPHDVTGTGPADFYDVRVKGVANGVTLYSNVNENGMVVNSLEELPKIISDYLFARIFFVNEEDEKNFNEIIRAYNFENMDQFAQEFDEAGRMKSDHTFPNARTKKVSAIGIKRVIYPELRILKHITYTVGEAVLYQFKYNCWMENQGYVNVEKNHDYDAEYLNDDQLRKWMLDEVHLRLEAKILPSDTDYPAFGDYWHDKALNYAEQASKADCPLNELDSIMGEFYDMHFRGCGVEKYFAGKTRAIADMAREIRQNIEKELLESWKNGDISVTELQKISRRLLEKFDEHRRELGKKLEEEKKHFEECGQDREDNVQEWSSKGFIATAFGKRKDRYVDHQEILKDYYTSKTLLVAWQFAQALAARILTELSKMDADIAAFAEKINRAIEETEKLIGAQQKVNKGLDDYKCAIIEVSEEEEMVAFEKELMEDKKNMSAIARQLRMQFLPEETTLDFGSLSDMITVDSIKDEFDIQLSGLVKQMHDDLKAASDKKILGLNILKELQQQLTSDDDIREFATKIVRQSGVFLKLNNDQMILQVPNNEGDLSPIENPASINQKTILISIPSDGGIVELKRFADKLVDAFKAQFGNGTAQCKPIINREVARADELSVITMQYCFPMRAVDWLADYKKRYERFLHSGNEVTDLKNSILLHSEGNGEELPSLFVLTDEEIAATKAKSQPVQQPGAVPPPMTGGPSLPPLPQAEKEVSVYVYIGGQQYGPYGRDILKQLVERKQLTPQTQVWMEGMASWMPAAQVDALQGLFAPVVPTPPAGPGMPPLPPLM